MTDLDKLEALAKAALKAKGDNARWEALDALEAAANPATILDLIASARRDAALLAKVHEMATEGHVKAGCDNWRAVERCRQIANLTAGEG